jgi:hypothetical protein
MQHNDHNVCNYMKHKHKNRKYENYSHENCLNFKEMRKK